jgi:hypothetical protein
VFDPIDIVASKSVSPSYKADDQNVSVHLEPPEGDGWPSKSQKLPSSDESKALLPDGPNTVSDEELGKVSHEMKAAGSEIQQRQSVDDTKVLLPDDPITVSVIDEESDTFPQATGSEMQQIQSTDASKVPLPDADAPNSVPVIEEHSDESPHNIEAAGNEVQQRKSTDESKDFLPDDPSTVSSIEEQSMMQQR